MSVLTEASIKLYMSDTLAIDTAPINPQTPLFSDGIIDSFALVSLLTLVEESCGIRVRPDEVTLENFDSIERILAFVRKKAG